MEAANLYKDQLITIAQYYFDHKKIAAIDAICNTPSFKKILEFDKCLGGIGLFNINIGRTGRYHVKDRDILRPLQYIYMDFEYRIDDLSWTTRNIIHMCGLHIEGIVKRLTGENRSPLGKILYNKKLVKKLDYNLMLGLKLTAHMFNAAKHEVSSEKDKHLFSIPEAIFCYYVTRQLAIQLYPLITLYTEAEVWRLPN